MTQDQLKNILIEKQEAIDSLVGHIKRLEKSNQELGIELRKCQTGGKVKGWD